jgi:integrase/recombinase XerC
LCGRTPRTAAGYESDLRHFAQWLGQPRLDVAVELLVNLSPGHANACAMAYRAHMLDRQLAPATISRRLTCLRSLVRTARKVGRVVWQPDVLQGPRSRP